MIFLLVILSVLAVAQAGGRRHRNNDQSFLYSFADSCFYSIDTPGDCDGLRKKRSDVVNIADNVNEELATILRATPINDKDYLLKTLKELQEVVSTPPEEGRKRRFFGAGYSFGFAFTTTLRDPECQDREVGVANFKVDISVFGFEISSAIELFDDFSLGSCEDACCSDNDDDDDRHNNRFNGGFFTKETVTFWQLERLFANPEQDDGSFLFRRKEAYAKNGDFYDVETHVNVATLGFGGYFYTVTVGQPQSSNSFKRDYLSLVGAGFGGVVLLGGALYIRKKRSSQTSEAAENTFEVEAVEAVEGTPELTDC